MHNEFIAQALGQKEIYEDITLNSNDKKCLIYAASGLGKHHLLYIIGETLQKKRNTCVLNLKSESNSLEKDQDFTPFLTMLSNQENTAISNIVNIGKNLTDFIPYAGALVSKLLEHKKVFPAIFSNTEIEIMLRLERVIGMKNTVLLCEDIDLWDDASARLLNKLLLYGSNTIIKSGYIICTSSRNDLLASINSFDKIYTLHPISPRDIDHVLTQILPDSVLAKETIERIFNLSGGNIGIIMRLIELVKHDETSLIQNSSIYRDITLQKLKNALNKSHYNNAVNLLDRAAIIGEGSYDQLLYLFTKYNRTVYSESISDTIQNGVLNKYSDKVNFVNNSVWNAFYTANYRNQQFHYELSKCIKELMPSNFSYIADELFRAGLDKEAAVYYILSSLNYYKTYRIIPQLYPEQIELMIKNELYDEYNKILELFTDYFSDEYDRVKFSTIRTSDRLLSFEVDYMVSLAYSNGSIKKTDLQAALTKLESWIEDKEFKTVSPFQWMRAALSAIGIQYELYDSHATLLLKKIEQTKRKYNACDKGMEWLEYDFFSKSNSCYSVDTAYHYTKQAVEYFEQNITHSPSMYPYYIALINAASNALVIGNYKEAQDLSMKALNLAQNGCYLYGVVDVLLNNYYIATLLDEKLLTNLVFEEIISQMEMLISKISKGEITEILMRNNLAIMKCYQSKFEEAFDILNCLFHKMQDRDDIDDYYLYFIGSNYCILSYLLKYNNFDYALFSSLCSLKPLSHDLGYFTVRNKYILSEINEQRKIDLNSLNWNDFTEYRVGPAWSFWGKWLIFSDVQLWSD